MIKPDQLSIGDSVVVLWEANPKGHGTVKANRINGEKVSKIVLPDNKASGPKPNPGETWACRVVRITNTLKLERIQISEALVREFGGHPDLEQESDLETMAFSDAGMLL